MSFLTLGRFSGDALFSPADVAAVAGEIRTPVFVLRDPTTGAIGLGRHGGSESGLDGSGPFEVLASLPALYPEWLGDRSFQETHRVRFPYVTGAMANGIATTRLVIAMAKAQMLGFFGAAGLGYERVAASVDELLRELGPGDGDYRWGVNLIHSPNEPALEARVADMLVERGVTHVEASAFM